MSAFFTKCWVTFCLKSLVHNSVLTISYTKFAVNIFVLVTQNQNKLERNDNKWCMQIGLR